jgi:hypothetical protein
MHVRGAWLDVGRPAAAATAWKAVNASIPGVTAAAATTAVVAAATTTTAVAMSVGATSR